MGNIDFISLRIFSLVAEKGSFIGAAKALQMPSSNVSRTISQLEDKLQVRLIERSTRHMRLTESGALLYSRSGALLDALAQLESDITSNKTQLKGPLRLCIPSEMGPKLLGDSIIDFSLKYPEISINCTTNLAGFESLIEDIDIAIIVTRGDLPDSDYIAQKLAEFPCCIVAAPKVIKQWGKPSNISDFRALPCITTATALQGKAWQFIKDSGEFHHISVSSNFKVNSGEMAFKAALSGVGFAILSRHACDEHIKDGSLIELNFASKAAPLNLYAVYSHRVFRPEKFRVFIDFLKADLAQFI
ncbi:LysR family transcriptional regulator [Moritella viscosa]|uniref:LysR-family transcriptional regulator n=1 Tax=Moritella viscosa TaxID=80854 RepID=A0A090IHK9_9GAMM|nr:LysR family transcriptional regulator [Moritella viscosa]CED59424.1 HTH-type transcriptional regulator, LysR family [Moritella viscosa]SGY86302.1 LysR-family transcriptional regulator [Moritella viscosa]SGY89336.1 LysR-family transcriptional regulator [Moritella viscosa]SGY89826.1 LysR-family transcriptional regulator [Moritella viscosa]SHO00634.1 LysR-family transcriptional regulator [Moritella viscosa]